MGIALVGLAALVPLGCVPEDPYDRRAESTPRSGRAPGREDAPRVTGPARGPASGELPGTAPSALVDKPTSFPEARRTPEATLRLAARLYGNWVSATAADRLARLASLSTGQAHVELAQAAAQAPVDRQQQGAQSRATVEAVQVRGAGPVRRGLVVTRELIRVPELPAAGWRYRLTLATVVREPEGWVLSQWQPQP